MYSIYADNICIYNDISPLDHLFLYSPKLILSDSASGSLSFTIPKSNIGYESIERLTTVIRVCKHDEEIFSGRVITEEKDFYNNRILYCEGELSFLNDSRQPQAEFHDISVRDFLQQMITVHNSQVGADKQFVVGTVTVTDSNDSLYRYTNYESTMDCISDKLLDRLGGHLRIRKIDGVRYLDYISEYPHQSTQTVEFGKNLMDHVRSWNMTNFATVILPLGCQIEESQIDTLTDYLTVKSVNNQSLYVKSESAVNAFGWIAKVVHWDDVKTPLRLLKKAQNYLRDIQFDDMTIELNALDLHYVDQENEAINLLDTIRVISHPHGMDRYFPVTRLEIPLDDPSNTIFTLGGTTKTNTLTAAYHDIQSSTSIELDTTRASLRQEFRAADGVLESTISATYATKSELATTETTLTTSLTQTASSIRTEVSRKVETTDFGSFMQQNYDSFLLGFNNNSKVIQIDTSGIGIYSDNSVGGNTRLIRMNGNGMEIWREGRLLGKIGTNNISGYPDYRGLVFDLDYSGDYMTWAAKSSSVGNYVTVFTYAKAGAVFSETGFYIGDSVFMSGHTLDKANLTNVRTGGSATFSGTKTFITAIRTTSDGGIEWDSETYQVCNGMFIN